VKQNIWLWHCDQHYPDNQWDESHLYDHIECMIKDLCNALRQGWLPHYYNPDTNLLEDVDRDLMNATADRIEFLSNKA
jgi:hypothetical protein